MQILAAVHVAVAKRARLAAVAAALLLIGAAIVVSVASDSGKGSTAADTAADTTAPPPAAAPDPAAEEHAHDSNIYVMNLHSRRTKRVTEGQIAQQPSWAPNKRITFSAADCDDACFSQLFYVD